MPLSQYYNFSYCYRIVTILFITVSRAELSIKHHKPNAFGLKKCSLRSARAIKILPTTCKLGVNLLKTVIINYYN